MANRELEHDKLPMPNGWFALEWSRDLHIGDVKPIEYFGEELVLFRTRSGEARVLDPFCPHLGAHLGRRVGRDPALPVPRLAVRRNLW